LFDVWEKNSWFLETVVDGVKTESSFVDPVHLSNRGHKISADHLAKYLQPFAHQRCTQITQANGSTR
jgi:lysophospholipase L1-like esterase